jgi:hypothetical protein
MVARKQKKSQKKEKYSVKLFSGGGCSAPDVVSQYINPMCHTMTQGFEGTTNIFQRVFEGPGPAETNLNVPQCHSQSGGGWTIDLENTIDKVPSYQRYNDEAPPVILNGKTYLSNYSQCGAGKISLYKVKQLSKKRMPSKIKSKSKSKSKSMSKRRVQRHHTKKSKKQHKSKHSSRRHKKSMKSKRQHGGEAPVNFAPDLMNMGGSVNEQSIFSPDMTTRDLGCHQPVWSPKCT